MRRLQTKLVQYLRTMEQVASGFGCVPLRQLFGLVWTSEEAFVAAKDSGLREVLPHEMAQETRAHVKPVDMPQMSPRYFAVQCVPLDDQLVTTGRPIFFGGAELRCCPLRERNL